MSRPDQTNVEPERLVVRDKRRLDPDSGAVREPASSSPPAPGGATGGAAAGTGGMAGTGGGTAGVPVGAAGQAVVEEVADAGASVDALAAELTADLQRVSAEYANYRKRVERDRVAVVEMATAGLLAELLPLLDDVDRARQHGDLTGAFQAVGDGLEAVTGKLGLERFGAPGEPFDPAVHEALMQAEPDPSATVPVCAQVLQPGYRLKGGRVLRPARVSVAEPAAEPVEAAPQPGVESVDTAPQRGAEPTGRGEGAGPEYPAESA